MADVANQGMSAVLNEDKLGNDRKPPNKHGTMGVPADERVRPQ